ncbi:alpha/beta hydrolase [Paucibacter sp. APW11]|uniref:Alpha/beta hydrolase n=1 Tax=Roseateles aquae TaxID=3077235 RepID=A0ABU3PGU1_9BURK|nr:alpha/beta hydrolase [Paucibacter sp. APW11]MDT9001694.1 alpha/beta hydrolase [Paucibacter sp. APW11]
MRRLHLVVLIALLALGGTSTAAPGAVPAAARNTAPASLGLSEQQWQDDKRAAWDSDGARPLLTLLWYPTDAAAPASAWPELPFELAPVQRDAAPRAGRLPLLLLSHGTGGSAVAMAWLAEGLARQGYLVAALNHHGNTGAEATYQLPGFLAWWERPRDLSAVLDRLLADPQWGPRIDTQRMGVIGFSLGGYTALAGLGLRLDEAAVQQRLDHCAKAAAAQRDPQCALPPEIAGRYNQQDVQVLLREQPRLASFATQAAQPLADARLRAALVLAPVLGPLYDWASLQAIKQPVLLIAGSADDQAPAAFTALPASRRLAQARISVLDGAGHYSFLSRCSKAAAARLPALCSDTPQRPRADVHREVLTQALDFFARALP